jgi:hypothetical protein
MITTPPCNVSKDYDVDLSLAIAALNSDCHYIGYDSDPEYIKVALASAPGCYPLLASARQP